MAKEERPPFPDWKDTPSNLGKDSAFNGRNEGKSRRAQSIKQTGVSAASFLTRMLAPRNFSIYSKAKPTTKESSITEKGD